MGHTDSTREKKIKHTPIRWYNLGRWLMAIENPDRDIADICNRKSEALYMLGTMAFTNINKVRGKSRSSKAYKEVAKSAIAGKLLRCEINIINPRIIICLGTFEQVKAHVDVELLQKNGCKIIDMPHSGARIKKIKMLEQLKTQLGDRLCKNKNL